MRCTLCAISHEYPTPEDTKEMLCCNEECSVVGPRYACKACLAAVYCSRECQQADWPFHKKECTLYTICRNCDFHPNEKYVNPRSQYIRIASRGYFETYYFNPGSRRYSINWALKGLCEYKCRVHRHDQIKILEELCSRVFVVFKNLHIHEKTIDWNVLSLKMTRIEELFIECIHEIENWDRFLSLINRIKPGKIIVRSKNKGRVRENLTGIDIAIPIVFEPQYSDTPPNDPKLDALRKKRKMRVAGVLLYAARLKNDQSPFYKDNLCPEMFEAILSFVKRAIMQ